MFSYYNYKTKKATLTCGRVSKYAIVFFRLIAFYDSYCIYWRDLTALRKTIYNLIFVWTEKVSKRIKYTLYGHHLNIDGYFNMQNFCIWGSENKIYIVKKPLFDMVYGSAGSLDLSLSKMIGLRYREMIITFYGRNWIVFINYYFRLDG